MNTEKPGMPFRVPLCLMRVFAFLLIFTLYFFYVGKDCSAAIRIQSRINNGLWVERDAIYPLKGDDIRLRVKETKGATIKWYSIIPDTSRIYKNANHPWEEEPYKWIGLAKIEYQKRELTQLRNQWEIDPFAEENEFKADSIFHSLKWGRIYPRYYHLDVGSFWFQAVVEKDGKRYRSPGLEDSDKKGISPGVFRISIREGEGYLGYLTSFFNVPGLFGSTIYQSNNYIGVDCADVLLAAYAKWKNIVLEKNYNVAMIVNEFDKVKEFEVNEGMPAVSLKWKVDVLPGDFIAVRYPGGKQYQHIGVLYSDYNRDNYLDENDVVIHAGPSPLRKSYMSEGAFDGHVVIIRP